jgi:hypothetical protein
MKHSLTRDRFRGSGVIPQIFPLTQKLRFTP